ncbi:uroporphyrin-III C-methyltransferase [Irineochytrium annulatum]|nr:uroporphyrin-III C-methyltransferase [Irineochytrium annulatum]
MKIDAPATRRARRASVAGAKVNFAFVLSTKKTDRAICKQIVCGPKTYRTFGRLYGDALVEVDMDGSFDRDNIDVGDTIEVVNDQETIWIARVTEKSRWGIRLVWFYAPEQTTMGEAAADADLPANMLFATSHCECMVEWIKYDSIQRKVSVSYSTEPTGADYYCPLYYCEEKFNFLPIDSEKSLRRDVKPVDLCGCVRAPSLPRDTIPVGISDRSKLALCRAIYKATTRKYTVGKFFGLRHDGRKLEDVIEVIDDGTRSSSPMGPYLRLRKFGRPTATEFVNQLEYANETLLIRGWKDIAEKVREEVFVEYWDRPPSDMPAHLRCQGASRNACLRFFSAAPNVVIQFFFSTAPPHVSLNDYPSRYPIIERPLSCLALMGGAGNFAIGLQESGFCVITKQIDHRPDCVASFNARMRARGNEEVGECVEVNDFLLRCVLGIRENPAPKLRYDVICVGLSCTAWSLLNRYPEVGKRAMIALLGSYAEFFKPKYMIVENVAEFSRDRTFAESQRAPYRHLVALMIGMGYSVVKGIHFAACHGVPQTRSRAIFAFAATGYPLPKLPAYTHCAETPTSVYYDTFFERPRGYDTDNCGSRREPAFRENVSAPCRMVTVRDIIGHLGPPIAAEPLSAGELLRQHVGRPLSNEMRTSLTEKDVVDWDDLLGTVTASRALKRGQRCVHPDGDRLLTNHEVALAQGFEEWEVHLLEGDQDDVRSQIGNAVPMNLAFAVGAESARAVAGWEQRRMREDVG